jgi:aldehyde dehydrogenase (NAD+)
MAVQTRYASHWFRYFGGLADKIEGSVIPIDKPEMLNFTRREPLGVVAAIVPWNSPVLLMSWKIAPALAAGNTVVVKPSEYTSASALEFAKLVRKVGFPAGVFNVVTGFGAEVGEPLATHPKVAKVAFTGGDIAGRRVYQAAAGQLKPVVLELGGKSPNIVFADADLDAALRGATTGIFYGKGEVCAAGSRLLVEASVHDEFIAKLAERSAKLQPADPLDPKTRLGALVSGAQMNKVLGYVETGTREGAKLVAGGKRAPVGGKGFFVQATVLDQVENHMKVAQEEIFGPVLSVIRFEGADDAVRKANDIVYGLAAGIWTRDVKKAHAIARRVQAGTVWINAYNFYDAGMPFGGYKASGFGRDLGPDSLREYTQVKSVWVSTD